METLSLSQFLAHLQLSRAPAPDLLSPAEASQLQLKIAEIVVDYRVDIPLLKFLSRFLTPQLYDELIEEKNIEHQCGYLVCGQSPKQQVRRRSSTGNGAGFAPGGPMESATRFRIYNRKPSMILPTTYLSQYCCKHHYQASLFYRNQLSSESLISRKGIVAVPPFPREPHAWYENSVTCLEEVLARHRELRDQGKSLGDVIAMMNGLTVADGAEGDADGDTAELVKLIEDFEIVENADPAFCEPDFGMAVADGPEDASTAARGVEGHYTAERRRSRDAK